MAGLAALLAACTGDPPSAFQPEAPFINPLLDPGLRGGLNVPDIEGAADDEARGAALAAEVVAALREAEIPAFAAPAVNGRHALVGRFASDGAPAVNWTLVDGKGRMLEQFVTAPRGEAPGPWMRNVAAAATAAINRHIAEAEGLPPSPDEMPKLTIVAIDGAPGGGGRALASALEHHLKKAGLTISDTVDDRGALVLGKVSLTPSKVPGAAATHDTLAFAWTVMRPDGKELGTIEQANDIPKGLLDRPWGDIAYVIAEGAAEGIVDLLRQTTRPAPPGAADGPAMGTTGPRDATRAAPP